MSEAGFGYIAANKKDLSNTSLILRKACHYSVYYEIIITFRINLSIGINILTSHSWLMHGIASSDMFAKYWNSVHTFYWSVFWFFFLAMSGWNLPMYILQLYQKMYALPKRITYCFFLLENDELCSQWQRFDFVLPRFVSIACEFSEKKSYM